VKTQAFNLRVESFSQFRQSKEEYRCGGDRKKVNRENNAEATIRSATKTSRELQRSGRRKTTSSAAEKCSFWPDGST
jgi:hypothetical protein